MGRTLYPTGFAQATLVAAEGARVALLSCRTCGAVVMADERDRQDFVELHRQWHLKQAPPRGRQGEEK